MSSVKVADRYTLEREIGRGGSGAVWLARDDILDRSVAIKRIGLPPGASAYDSVRAEREARISAQVNHANVVSVFDFVNDGEHTWLVTEYVEGTTLAQLVRDRGPLTPDEATPLLLQVAEALAAAHATEIVHRDVKPSNILVGLDGTAKLADFGIARAVADASLTQTGLITGSPAYIAPEVATGATATTASDVWSFGATVFHALAGRPPYEAPEGENAVLGVLYRVAHEPTPQLDDGGWLAPLVRGTMQQGPADRMSMEDVVAYLRAGPEATDRTRVLAAVGPPTPPPPTVHDEPVPERTAVRTATGEHDRTGPATRPGPPRRTTRVALMAAAAVLVVGAVATAVLLIGGDEDPGPTTLPNNTGAASSSTSGSQSQSPAEEPTAEELESFASTYVTTAAQDPDAGFALLTPAYQERSPEYADFWGTMSNPKMLDVSADPAAMTVTYTYQYDWPADGNITETVTLQLVQEGDQLLIDDAVTAG